MRRVILDANAVIMHGRAFGERVRVAAETEVTLVLPRSVKRELVTADKKPRETVHEIATRRGIADRVTLSDPLTVL